MPSSHLLELAEEPATIPGIIDKAKKTYNFWEIYNIKI